MPYFYIGNISSQEFSVTGSSESIGKLNIFDLDSSNKVVLKPPNVVNSDISLTLPGTITGGKFIKTDAEGVLSFSSVSELEGSTINIKGDTINIKNNGNNKTLATLTNESSVDLYFNNSKKFETTSAGITITGSITSDGLSIGDNENINVGTSNDLQILHDGTDTNLTNNTGKLNINSEVNTSNSISIFSNGGTSETIELHNIQGNSNSAIKLVSKEGGITLQGKNQNSNVLINNSPLLLEQINAPTTKTDKLYNTGGNLYWNNIQIDTTSLSDITPGNMTSTLITTPTITSANAIVIRTADSNSNLLDTIGIHNYRNDSNEAIMIRSSNGGITLYGGGASSNIVIKNSPLYFDQISIPSINEKDNRLWNSFDGLKWGDNTIADDNGTYIRLDQIRNPFNDTNISSYSKMNITSSDSYNGSNAISFVSNGISGQETIGLFNLYGTSNEAIILNSKAGGLTLGSNVGNVYITSGTPAVSNFVLTHEGNMGFGKLHPEKKIHIYGSDNSIRLEDISNNKWDIKIDSSNLKLYYNNSEKGEFSNSNGAYTNTSDKRLKENVKTIQNALEIINKLNPSTYKLKNSFEDTSENNWIFDSGLIAQEVYYNTEELRHLVFFENTVTPNINYEDEKQNNYASWGNNPIKLNYTGFIPYLIKSIQELKSEIDKQNEKIILLSNEINKLKM